MTDLRSDTLVTGFHYHTKQKRRKVIANIVPNTYYFLSIFSRYTQFLIKYNRLQIDLCGAWYFSQSARFPVQGSWFKNHWVTSRSAQPIMIKISFRTLICFTKEKSYRMAWNVYLGLIHQYKAGDPSTQTKSTRTINVNAWKKCICLIII